MPGMGGIEGAARIRERAPDARILLLSMHDQARDVRRAFDAGADGYLLKSAADEDLVRAVRAVAAGERYVHPVARRRARRARAADGPLDELTEREREVLRLLALGHTNQEIAEQPDRQRAHRREPPRPRDDEAPRDHPGGAGARRPRCGPARRRGLSAGRAADLGRGARRLLARRPGVHRARGSRSYAEIVWSNTSRCSTRSSARCWC